MALPPLVASGLRPDVEGGILPPGMKAWRCEWGGLQGLLCRTILSAGQDARLYGRPEARRYRGGARMLPTLRTSAVAQPTSLPPRKQPMLLLYCNSRIQSTNNAAAKTLTYDLNGNLISAVTSTSTNTYEWDAADSDQPWNQSI